jgi:hypothetical protein
VTQNLFLNKLNYVLRNSLIVLGTIINIIADLRQGLYMSIVEFENPYFDNE